MAKKLNKNFEQNEQPKKKVKKVGRPKKRGRKKSYYKKVKSKKTKAVTKKGSSKNLTYNRVRHVLWLNHKDDFPSYRAFISNKTDDDGNKIQGSSIVSIVFRECKSLECNDEDILSIYHQHKDQNPNDLPPVLPDDYFNAQGYWRILTDNYWDGMDERLWIVSSTMLTDPDYFLGILGEDRYVNKDGESITYDQYKKDEQGSRLIDGKKVRFQEFVNYCNRLQMEKFLVGSDEVPHFRFAGKTDDEFDRLTFWNGIEKRWEVRIVICSPTSEIEDYGFIPTESEQQIDTTLIRKIKEKPIEKPIEKSTIEDKEIELEKAKAETKKAEAEIEKAITERKKDELRMKIIELFANDKITEAKMDKMLKDIG